MGRSGRGKGRMERAIAAAQRDVERARVGLPPTQMAPMDRAANARLESRAMELGLDLNPPADVKPLVFNNNRKWRSVDNHKQFLAKYAVFQDRKLEPKVFADESTTGRPLEETEYISWYQTNRFHYFKTRGRLSDLGVLDKVKHWPNIPRTMTSAPLMRMPPSEHQYVENVANRNRGLFKVLNKKDIARIILGDLAEDGFISLSSLSRTCHTGLNLVSQYVEHWDVEPPGDFLGDDVSVGKDPARGTPITLMISPIRKPSCVRTSATYAEHYESQTKMYRALNNRADSLTNLQLHRVHFLDHNAVRCVLASLPNLKLIGIYQCQLLHLGNMGQLLRDIKVNARRKGHDYSFVELDFFPMYHEGPNSIMRHGSYGAVWNHPDCDMATGIWQLVLYELYPQARNLNIDILKWGCAFRSFLEKLPMTNWANVRICEAIKSFEYTGQEWTSELTMTAYNHREGKWESFIDDVTAALRGDGSEPATILGRHLSRFLGNYQPTRQRRYGWWRDLKYCGMCCLRIPAVFFPFDEGRCWGCLTKICLNGDWDHYKTLRQQAAAAWFARCRNLADVTAAGSADEGFLLAQKMDEFRALEMENRHGTKEVDWPDHPDFGRLHRRYARNCESHGPVDRMLNDRQYMPVGSFNTSITERIVPSCYPQYKLPLYMRAWEIAREEQYPKEPETKRAPARHAYLEQALVSIERDAQKIIAEQEARDARTVEDTRNHYHRRQLWPNRQIKCWDELVQDMFYRQDVIKPDGQMLMMPKLLTEQKRPYGALRWTA